MNVRLWVDKETLEENLDSDGDLVLNTKSFYCIRGEDMYQESGWYFGFDNYPDCGFEIFIPDESFVKVVKQTLGKAYNNE